MITPKRKDELYEKKKKIAEKLVAAHFQFDKAMKEALVSLSDSDDTIRLLEVTNSVPETTGELEDFYFQPAPADGIDCPSAVILVSENDWERVKKGEKSIPESWGKITDMKVINKFAKRKHEKK